MQKYSSEEQANHLSTWRASGLSGQEYCRQHDIVSTTFYSWVKAEKKRAAREETASPAMVRVQPNKQKSGTISSAICIEKRDIRIHLPADIGPESLQMVLQLLGVIDAT